VVKQKYSTLFPKKLLEVIEVIIVIVEKRTQ